MDREINNNHNNNTAEAVRAEKRTHCYSLQETGVTCPAEARGFMSHRNLLREQPQHCCWGPSELRNARFHTKAATGQNRWHGQKRSPNNKKSSNVKGKVWRCSVRISWLLGDYGKVEELVGGHQSGPFPSGSCQVMENVCLSRPVGILLHLCESLEIRIFLMECSM